METGRNAMIWALMIFGLLATFSIAVIVVLWEMFDNEEGIDD